MRRGGGSKVGAHKGNGRGVAYVGGVKRGGAKKRRGQKGEESKGGGVKIGWSQKEAEPKGGGVKMGRSQKWVEPKRGGVKRGGAKRGWSQTGVESKF